MPLPQRIYLVGMPASGKTTLGKKIACALSYPFYDLDWEIERKAGKSIPEIFEQEGEGRFREMEREVLESVKPRPAVIATGGGAPCFFDNMDLLLHQGLCLYLEVPPAVLAQRAWVKAGSRPLLNQPSLEDMQQAIEEKLSRRKAFYERAHYHVSFSELKKGVDWKFFFEEVGGL